MSTILKEYKPSADEEFMSPRQLEYFRQKLNAWKAELQKESAETLEMLQEHRLNEPDLSDRASSESDRSIELRARDRQRKLVSKIDQAIARIDDGSY
ncbi:MAG: RNA polymerase-binding protein DksA, partial [Pseudomonadota bacterium]